MSEAIYNTQALAQAAARLRQMQLVSAFDASNLESRPNAVQTKFFEDINQYKIRLIRAGGQCLAAGTLVRTTKGPTRIEQINVGDLVFDEFGNTTPVLATFQNGKKKTGVARFVQFKGDQLSSLSWVRCTPEHEFMCAKEGCSRPVVDIHQTVTSVGELHYVIWEDDGLEVDTFDLHVGTPENLYQLASGIITHNSGKTSSAAREVVWILEDSHPYWKRPDRWKNESLLIIVAGQDREMMEIEIWSRKIQPLLTRPQDWRPVRSGNALKHVVNKRTGDMIVFISHADSSETNRKHMQGYVGHYVWMDELSDNLSIIEELQRRVVSKDGYFTLTFTPKGKSGDIRRWADSLEPPLGNVYRMGQLDNPLFAARREEMLARVAMMPEGLRNTVLYGDWEIGDKAVYGFDRKTMVSRPPEDYSTSWRHVEGSDPAVSSKFGLVVLANEPNTDNWWVVRADYVHGIVSPDDIVKEVIKRTSSYNIVRRVVDSHESWYKGMASKMGLTYMQPYDKNNRKSELIKGLQLALSTGRVKIAPWCTDLIAELQAAQWADTDGKDKIQNSKSYHTADALQYVVDCLPKPEDPISSRTWEEELRFGNKKRKELEQLKQKMKVGRKRWTFNNGSLTRLR